MKLITRQNGEFDILTNPDFTGYPQKPTDNVRINITREEMKFIFKNLDWSLITSHFNMLY